jgi:molecular chaperone HtpG
MSKTQGTISVQTENIFPIIKKFLYSDHEIFLRELVSNAVDACQKSKILEKTGEIAIPESYLVRIAVDKSAKTITISDNGIGMTAEEIEKYITQIAFSGAAEFVNKYQDAQIIGHFGLGFYSAFMVSSKVEIRSLSRKHGSTAVRWECDGSPEFYMEAAEKDGAGTDIILHIGEDSEEFLDENRLEEILMKYCRFMPVLIQFGFEKDWIDDPNGTTDENGKVKRIETESPKYINQTTPIWIKKPSELQDEDYSKFYRELYPMSFEEPLFHIHINIDFPFNLTGILFFPKIKYGIENQRNKIALYSNQVFITDEVKNILPDFLTLLHGVIDSPDIPLNVSRSYLQEDANVKKISQHITKKVADKLTSMFNQNREDFEMKWNDIQIFIQYGMLTDEKFYEKAAGFYLYEDETGKKFTLEELKTATEALQKDKSGDLVLLYTNDKAAHHAEIEKATERSYKVLEMSTPLSSHLVSHLEMKNQHVRFKRIDADIIDRLIEKEEGNHLALTEDEQNNLKTKLESIAADGRLRVQFAGMSSDEIPFTITQNEFMRRMKEQSAMGGNSFYGQLPESYDLVVNGNHPLIAKLKEGEPGSEEKIKQAIDLALLSKGMLKGEGLTRFIQRSIQLLA